MGKGRFKTWELTKYFGQKENEYEYERQNRYENAVSGDGRGRNDPCDLEND